MDLYRLYSEEVCVHVRRVIGKEKLMGLSKREILDSKIFWESISSISDCGWVFV